MDRFVQQRIRREWRVDENNIVPPMGWIGPQSQIADDHANEREIYRQSVAYNLPRIAKRAERLIEALRENLDIFVPISYLRIDNSTTFHVLLLVELQDFLSPNIHAARLLSDKYKYEEDSFYIRFIFSVKSENMIMDTMLAQGYKLMHINDTEKNAV